MITKSEYRKIYREKRKSLSITEISEAIVRKIRATEIYQKSENIMLFYPLKTEINLLELLSDKKQFYLPRVNDNVLEVCTYKKGDILKKSEFNIFEPLTEQVKAEILDIVFVPALCADRDFNRIGYGCGYYDRFIYNSRLYNSHTKFVIVIPEELIIKKTPIDDNDCSCDGIITQKKTSFYRG